MPPPPPSPESASSGTATSSPAFVETLEHKRFVEFCEACRHFRYIGLCYGPPGIGKTLSAVRYSRADRIVPRDRWTSEVSDDLPVDTLLYTTSVINTPSGVRNDINMARESVRSIVLNPIRREASAVLEGIRVKDERRRREIMEKPGCSPCDRPAVDPTYFERTSDIRRRSGRLGIPPPSTTAVEDGKHQKFVTSSGTILLRSPILLVSSSRLRAMASAC
jgi:hypothetical protein